MPEAMTRKDKDQLSKDDIINWLRHNPDFLSRNPEVCDFLTPPKATSGKGVADFQYYMVQRLKADRDDVLESAREIVETSRTNMNNQARIHKAVLMLLEARTFEDFIRIITMDFMAILNVDIISLAVEADGQTIPQITFSGVRAMSAGTVDLLMKDRAIQLENHIHGFEDLYGGGAGLVKSQALVRLPIADGAPPALLAFGSRDPAMFEPGQGTELISFLGQVTGRMMNIWLDVEQGA